MSPALINQAPAYSQNPSFTHGQSSHLSSFNCPEFSQENPFKFHQSYSSTMTPTNAGDDTSGFPCISRSRSDLSRPRRLKAKRGSSSRNLRSTIISESQDSLEVNQFRNIRENLVTASSRSETGASVAAESGFGKICNDAFVFGTDRNHMRAKFNDLNSGGTLIRGVAEELKNLIIKNDNDSKGGVLDSNSSDKSGKETFVFGANMKDCVNMNDLDCSVTNRKGIVEDLKNLKIGNSVEFVNPKGGVFDPNSSCKPNSNVDWERVDIASRTVHSHSSSIDENIKVKLSDDMSKLKIESHKNEDSRETVKDGKFVSSAKDKLGNSNNVTGFLEKNLESELPDELQKKLNLKETVQIGAPNVIFNDVDMNKFEFGRSRKDGDPSVKSIESTLHSHMENLNIKDHLSTSNENNLASSKTMAVRWETIMSRNKKSSSDASYVGDILSFNLDKSKKEEHTFHRGTQVKHPSGGSQAPSDQPEDGLRVRGNAAVSSLFSSSGTNLERIGSNFEVPEKRDEYTFLNNRSFLEKPFEFKTPNQKMNIADNSIEKSELEARTKKRGGKSGHPTEVHLSHGQAFVLRGSSSKENLEASDSYSPMDISPYQEILADNQYSRETSVTSDESSSCNLPTDSVPTNSVDAVVEDVLMATQRLDINERDVKCEETKDEFFESHFDTCVGADGPPERSVSMAETESYKSAMEDVDCISDNIANSVEIEATSSSNIKTHYSDCRTQFCFASSSGDIKGSNFTFSASSSTHGQSTASKRLNRKKSLAKLGQDVNLTIPFSGSSLLLSPGRNQRGDPSPRPHKCGDDCVVDKGPAVKQESISTFSAAVAAQEACEKWRSRGNQAYTAGELSRAEDFYTQGVNCVSRGETSKSCLRALMLCYSNRAATRMSLGRMRDALSDCVLAAEIDPNFLKVQLRAANCYLALGEVEGATQHFKRCLQPGSYVRVDQKIAVEASDGLHKVQRVYECINASTELLQRKTSNDVGSALELIAEALIISPFSEQLLEMKAEALFLIRSYEEAIGLCEQTSDSAEKNSHHLGARENFANLDRDRLLKYFNFRFWRSQIILKCYFYLGRLENGLASLEKQEEKLPITYRNESKILESSLPLAVTVCKLLRHKTAGNEAFQAGRHIEAVEHYTAALSCSVESRPFAAVCFCNRAAAYKALGQITDAIADCSLAMALDRNYRKAISRRATLLEMIRDYGQVVTDLRRLISLLTKQVGEKTSQLGGSDRSLNCTSDLRQARIRLSEIEEDARRDIPLDMYLILGVEPFAPASEIKKAYRKAALRHHPDKASQFLSRSDNGDDVLWKEIAKEVYKDADRLFKMIGEAYAVLSEPTKRARYDSEEEMRNAQKKRNGSSSSRPPSDVQNYPFDRSGNRRQWNDIGKSYGKSASRGAEATCSSRYM